MSQDDAALEPLWRQFSEARLREGNLNDHLDLPEVVGLIPDGMGKRALDLGCGLGQSSFLLAEKLNYRVIAVDGSTEMLARARELYTGERIEWIEEQFENLSIAQGSINLIVSCLCFHFVADLEALIEKCALWLEPAGKLVFSVRHPIRTANPSGETQNGNQVSWLVKDYFNEDTRRFSWLGNECVNYHRTLSTYVRYLTGAGLTIETILEPYSTKEELNFADESRSVPFVLTIASRKPPVSET
jgi:SAM-dependent methyltransferase